MGRPPSQPFARHLKGEWLELFERVSGRHDRHHLRGFMGYLSHLEIAPPAAAARHLEAYKAELRQRHVPRISQIGRDVAKTWNAMAKTCRAWPPNRLTLVDSLGFRSLPFTAFPRSFEMDVRAYLDRKPSKHDLFAKAGRKSFALATRSDRASKIRLMATIAVDCGVSATSFRSIKDLIEIDTAERLLEEIWRKHDYKPNGHAANLVRVLISIATHVKAKTSWIEKLRAAEKNMRPKESGMTERNRERLRLLTQDGNLRRLVRLPQVVLDSLNKNKPTVTDANRLQSALGMAILFCCPMREKNVVNLHDGQLDRDRYIVISGDEVKNQRTLHFKLPSRVEAMLGLYRRRYLPLLAKGNGAGLFVSRNGKRKLPSYFAAQLPKFIARETGLKMNVHLFRHLAGYIFLREHPGEYEPVRQLLGHDSIKTTIAFYTGFEEEETFSRYDAILDRLGRDEAGNVSP